MAPKAPSKFRLTVEPVGFLYLSSVIVQSIVVQNLYLQKTCAINLHLNSSICDSRNHSVQTQDDDNIQRYVTYLNVVASFIENIPSVLVVLFLGPWSDKIGRKTPMVCPLVGLFISTLIYVLNYWFPLWPAEYLLFASIPTGLSGGATALFMSMNSYIADVSSSETRTSRISLLYGFLTVSFPVSMFSSIYIYTYGGYLAIWGTSLAIATIAVFYLIFFVSESQCRKENDEDEDENPGELFASEDSVVQNVWKCFLTTFRERTEYKRAAVCILLVSMSLYVFAQVPSTVSYLYVRKRFEWDQPQYALFSTVASIITVLGSFLLLPLLSSYFKIHDCVVGVIALVGNIVFYVCQAAAETPEMMYFGSIGLVLTTATGVVIRSMLSKQVPRNELSHVYSVLASFESIVPLMASPAFNILYESTLDAFPGCVFIFASGVLLVLVVLLLVVFLLQWRESNTLPYNSIETEPVVEIF